MESDGPVLSRLGANSCLSGAGTTNLATWTLVVPTNDPCTIQVWLPAVPSNSWSQAVLYEVWSGTSLLASGHDGSAHWRRPVAHAGQRGELRLLEQRAGPCPRDRQASFLADALHLYSASRYNDGSAAASVTLQPMDGIVLAASPGLFADRDRDGLPDYWEQAHFGNPTTPCRSRIRTMMARATSWNMR